MTRGRKVTLVAILLTIVLVAAEVVSYAGGRVLQSKWAMWRVPEVPKDRTEELSFDDYMERRDPVLGWPYPRQYGADLDENGAQRNPYFPDGGVTNRPCISMYGDSFTEGGDTSGLDKNWGNLLSKDLGCYIANYGFGGYGSDQAYIRFIENETDASEVTIFGYHTADTIRNLTRIRDLQNYSIWYALKPRFIYSDSTGEISLIPIPDMTEDEFYRAIGVRGKILELEHETLQPNGPAGAVQLEFPYTVSVIRNLIGFYGFRSRLAGEPGWMMFLQPDHPLNGLEITVGIARDFVALSRERGKQALVLILPHPRDFEYEKKNGEWPYRHVAEGFESEGLLFEDFGPHLIAAAEAEGRPLKSFFGPTGHYNDDGNAVLAKFVREALQNRSLVPTQ